MITQILIYLIVDDNSPDGTRHKVRELQSKYKNLHLEVREKKLLGTAYILVLNGL